MQLASLANIQSLPNRLIFNVFCLTVSCGTVNARYSLPSGDKNIMDLLQSDPARGLHMGNKLNGTSQIWADGYSFMEVTETLLAALGIRTDDQQAPEQQSRQTETFTAASDDMPERYR